MNSPSDTIAAIATAPGEAGIAIVRVSGTRSLEIADAVFSGPGQPPSRRPANSLVYGRVRGMQPTRERRDLDEVVLLIFRAPRSYTREDLVEIQSHGGRTCARRILQAVLAAGARPAEPGEFTRRAFLNGRIDLVQAEAVLDLVRARTDRAASAALEQLHGEITTLLASICDDIMSAAVNIEASLDFPDEDLPDGLFSEACDRLRDARRKVVGMLGTWDEGHVLREGALVVISGRPNAGKSTLLNCLVGKDRAIVTEVPGTTRDMIEEQIVVAGVPLRVVDTAGLRDVECRVERMGVDRAREAIRTADVNLYVLDASLPLHADDINHFSELREDNAVLILNKTDLGMSVKPDDCLRFDTIRCSLLRCEGLEDIRGALMSKLGIHSDAPPHAVISERHRLQMQEAQERIGEALAILTSGAADGAPLAAQAVRAALERLGTITGTVYSDELLDSIFRLFCIGK